MPDQLESTLLHGMACHVKLIQKRLYLLAMHGLSVAPALQSPAAELPQWQSMQISGLTRAWLWPCLPASEKLRKTLQVQQNGWPASRLPSAEP